LPVPGRPDVYLVAWMRLRRRRSRMGVGGSVLFMLVAPVAVIHWVPRDARILGFVLAWLLALPVMLFALSLLEPFRCPACHRLFFPSRWEEMGRDRKCARCGIEIGTPERKGTRWPEELVPKAADSHPARRAFGWLVATSTTAWASYEFVRHTPSLAGKVLALAWVVGCAIGFTTLVGWRIRSRAFPKELLMPVFAFVLASMLAVQINRTDRSLRFQSPPFQTFRHAYPACPDGAR
jgi:NOL1/NOP2/fmu family ribosome biogenesis protein